jgi:formate hydrogenlyase transcriptional activator
LADESTFELSYRRFAQILGTAEAVTLRHHPETLFRALAPRLRTVIAFDLINFALHDPDTGKMKMFLWDGLGWPSEPVEVGIEESAVGAVWQTQALFSADDLRAQSHSKPGLSCIRDRDLRSYCVLPLSVPHEKLGALGFGSKAPYVFTAQDICFLRRVAEIVALCMDHSLAEAALHLVPLVSTSSTAPMVEKTSEVRDGTFFSARDLALLKQIAAALVPLIEGDRAPATDLQLSDGGTGLSVTPERSPLRTFPAPVPGMILDAPGSSGEWEKLLAIYSEASTVGFCVVDSDFRYQAVNPVLAKLNRAAPQEHLGKTVREILGLHADPVHKSLKAVVASGESLLDREIAVPFPGAPGASRWVAHYIPVPDGSGKVTRIGVVLIEATERKKLEDVFRRLSDTLRSERNRNRFLVEVNQILTDRFEVRQSFSKLSACLRRLLRHEYASLSLLDRDSLTLVQRAIDFPLQKHPAIFTGVRIPQDPRERALRECAPLIFGRHELSEINCSYTDYLLQEGLQSLCCVPLLRPESQVGVLALGSTRSPAFRPEDVGLLQQVSAQLAVALENQLAAQKLQELKVQSIREKDCLQAESSAQAGFPGLVGESRPLQSILSRVAIVAETSATVLLLGETGTGKGLVARALHQASRRKHKSFVTLNCAAIPTGLIESELFGHEKGAFTGAISQKTGRFEVAEGGTLFLDEIGEIPRDVQPKLLRVLQDHEFERLGGHHTIKVDIRLIAATNRDLARSVLENQFRSDLFYRLNVFPLRLPALRERRSDIPLLVRHFVQKFSARLGRTIETVPTETMNALVNYHWPGNIRELENFVERSVILTVGTALESPLAELLAGGAAIPESLEEAERALIIKVLRETGGVVSGPLGAAQRLGLKRTTLQSKIERLGISPLDYSGSPAD